MLCNEGYKHTLRIQNMCTSPYNRPLRPRGEADVQLCSFFNLGARWSGWSTPLLCRFKVSPDRREIFAAVATTTISPKFRVDCDKAIRVVIHTNATVLW